MDSISNVSLSNMYTPENGPIDFTYVFAINCPHFVNTSVVIVKWGPSVVFPYLRENQTFLMLFHILYKHCCCLLVANLATKVATMMESCCHNVEVATHHD